MQLLNNLKLILRYNCLFIILIFIAIIYVLIFTVLIKYESKFTGDETVLTGEILEYSINGSKLQMQIKSKEEIIATYYIKSEDEKKGLLKKVSIGDSIYLTGSMKLPENNTIPNNFNYKRYLYNQRFYH